MKMIRTGSRIVFLEGGAATIADLDYPAAFNTKLTPEDQQVFFYFAPNIQEYRHQAFREAWGAPVPYILKAKKFAEPLFQSKTRPNWARKVRELILFNVLCTVYCGRGFLSLESEGKEIMRGCVIFCCGQQQQREPEVF